MGYDGNFMLYIHIFLVACHGRHDVLVPNLWWLNRCSGARMGLTGGTWDEVPGAPSLTLQDRKTLDVGQNSSNMCTQGENLAPINMCLKWKTNETETVKTLAPYSARHWCTLMQCKVDFFVLHERERELWRYSLARNAYLNQKHVFCFPHVFCEIYIVLPKCPTNSCEGELL